MSEDLRAWGSGRDGQGRTLEASCQERHDRDPRMRSSAMAHVRSNLARQRYGVAATKVTFSNDMLSMLKKTSQSGSSWPFGYEHEFSTLWWTSFTWGFVCTHHFERSPFKFIAM